jgi:hypothetical protein
MIHEPPYSSDEYSDIVLLIASLDSRVEVYVLHSTLGQHESHEGNSKVNDVQHLAVTEVRDYDE